MSPITVLILAIGNGHYFMKLNLFKRLDPLPSVQTLASSIRYVEYDGGLQLNAFDQNSFLNPDRTFFVQI